jgi:predicted Zn-dependent peptidase
MPVVCEEIADVAHNVTDAELERARAQLKASILMSRESTSGRCEQLASNLLVYGRPLTTQEIVDAVEAVDADQVRRLAQRLAASRPTLTSLGPVDRVESFDTVAKRFAA